MVGLLVRLRQLSSIETAERIRGEVTEHPVGPVAILEHAIAIRRRLYSEQRATAFIPGRGQIPDAERPVEERHLELVTEQDVQVVRDFVSRGAEGHRRDTM